MDAELLEGAPGDTALLRTVARDEEVERLRDAAHGREFELSAAVAQIANDAIEAGAAIVENGRRQNHCVAARLEPLFSPTKHDEIP